MDGGRSDARSRDTHSTPAAAAMLPHFHTCFIAMPQENYCNSECAASSGGLGFLFFCISMKMEIVLTSSSKRGDDRCKMKPLS